MTHRDLRHDASPFDTTVSRLAQDCLQKLPVCLTERRASARRATADAGGRGEAVGKLEVGGQIGEVGELRERR